ARDAEFKRLDQRIIRRPVFSQLDAVGRTQPAAPRQDLELIVRVIYPPRRQHPGSVRTLRRGDAVRKRGKQVSRLVGRIDLAMLWERGQEREALRARRREVCLVPKTERRTHMLARKVPNDVPTTIARRAPDHEEMVDGHDMNPRSIMTRTSNSRR